MMSGEGQGEVSAGRRGAATKASRPLEETLLLLTLLLSEFLLILKHLPTSGHINKLSGHGKGVLRVTGIFNYTWVQHINQHKPPQASHINHHFKHGSSHKTDLPLIRQYILLTKRRNNLLPHIELRIVLQFSLSLSSHLEFSQLQQVLSEGDRREQRRTPQQQHIALLPLAAATERVLVAHP